MLGVLLAVSLSFTSADADFAHSVAGELVERHTPRDAGTPGARGAAYCILDRASAAGADVRMDRFTATTPKGERSFMNLVSEFGGNPTNGWVVLVSHYDTKPGSGCPGANDGASTSGLLAAFAAKLADLRPFDGNVMLVWVDGEECMRDYAENDGFWGSRRMAEELKRSGRKVQAVVCLDMLGDADLQVMVPQNVDAALAKIAVHAARKAGMDGIVSPSDYLVKDDHVPFMEAGFRSVDLIDFDYGPGNSYWHTAEDTMERISRESLLKSGKLVAALLNILL